MMETINPLLRLLRIPFFIIVAFFFLLSSGRHLRKKIQLRGGK
jgi:hypothetical protein